MNKNRAGFTALICILLAASFLRLVFISRGDTINDEVLYAFRAIDMLDFDEAAEQTTPLEWFDPLKTGGESDIPWWTALSFHDHPPLVFLIQHFFMRIFGESRLGFRLPSALFGIASVWLLYLIGKELYSKDAGLIAAGLLAITVNHVYISRIGLQESYVIFFILLASYLFLRTQKNDTYYLWTGAALGLGFITKYNTFILAPIFLTYLVLFNRKAFRNKKFWLGALFALVIFTPVIVYNIELYRAVGHFDFQFSFIFGQHPKVWSVTPGKEIGSINDRLSAFLPNLAAVSSPLFLTLVLTGFIWLLITLVKYKKNVFRQYDFLLLAIFFHIGLLLQIGTAYRFVSMLTPWFAILAALPVVAMPRKKIFLAIFGIVLLSEIAYTINSQIAFYPAGPKLLAFAKGARLENYNWGFNKLDRFLTNEFAGRHPAAAFEQKYTFIERIHENALRQAIKKGFRERSAIFIYDGNIDTAAQLWVLDRWQIYHAWPVIKTESYLDYLQENKFPDIKDTVFKEHYFIALSDTLPKKVPSKQTQIGSLFEKELVKRGIAPTTILKNDRGDEVFRIYIF